MGKHRTLFGSDVNPFVEHLEYRIVLLRVYQQSTPGAVSGSSITTI